jgi:hypothetical protein
MQKYPQALRRRITTDQMQSGLIVAAEIHSRDFMKPIFGRRFSPLRAWVNS